MDNVNLLNSAWKAVEKSLDAIKKVFPKDNEVDHFIYKMRKLNAKLHVLIMKRLESQYNDTGWNRLMRGLKDERPKKNR